MPYIDERSRERVAARGPRNPGELAYVISAALNDYVAGQERVSFADLAAVLGALESSRVEFYEAVVEPYEKIKRFSNGDVFDEARDKCRIALGLPPRAQEASPPAASLDPDQSA